MRVWIVSNPEVSAADPGPVDYRLLGPLYSAWARALSLLAALLLAGILLLVPMLLMREPDHTLLMLGMWGISAGFVHGVGYVPHLSLWRWLLGPWLAWPLMLWLVWASVMR